MTPYYQDPFTTIYHDRCEIILPLLQREHFNLIIADPPYGHNMAKTYADHTPPDLELWQLIVDVLAPGGALYWWGFWYDADHILAHGRMTGLKARNRITWWHRSGRPQKGGYRQDTEDAYYFTKGAPAIFNEDAIREPYEKVSNYRVMNPLGKHPGTVWVASRIAWNSPEASGHETQKPQRLIEKMVKASSNPGSLVLDPTCGSGTTLAAAKMHGRYSIGVDCDERSCEMAARRLEKIA